jgi:hypothetical protein
LLLLAVTPGLASVVRFRDRNWQHEELFARRATVGEKIGLGLDGMGLATDQAHQRAAALAKQWRQEFFLSDFYLFHDPTLGRAAPASILFLCNQFLRESRHLRGSVLWNSFINSRVLLTLQH